MESFSLLKYWRTTGVVATARDSTTNARATAASPYSSDDEDGTYFDLEFALPDDDNDSDNEEAAQTAQENDEKTHKKDNDNETKSSSGSFDDEGELKLTIESNGCTEEDQTVKVSPSDELFVKGNLVSIEPSSILLNGSVENSKLGVSLLKSATKFRVMLLKLKKPKSGNEVVEKIERIEANDSKIEEKQGKGKQSGMFFTVKMKAEEVKAPILSYIKRDSSSKQNQCKGVKNQIEDSADSSAASDERKLSKEVVQKYFNMVKPLYIRVSKRYVEKLKFSGHLSFLGGDSKTGGGADSPPAAVTGKEGESVTSCVRTNLKHGNSNLQAGLKVVRKHLGKSRSASATVVSPPTPLVKMVSDRRDDSLIQLQDGIQGAIMHCKRSIKCSRDGECSTILSRSASDDAMRSV